MANFRNLKRRALPSGYPNYEVSFEAATAGYAIERDYSFGTGAHPEGSTPIENVTDLAEHFNPYAANAGTAVINSEIQRYMPFDSAENFVFANDALELTATLQDTPAGVAQVEIVSVDGATVEVDDASAILVGQMVSLGAKQDANMHITQSYGIRGTLGVGNTLTVTVFCSLPAWHPDFFETVVLTQTVTAESTHAGLAQNFVDQVNAHPDLAQVGMTAFKAPVDPGAYAITWRRYSGEPFIAGFGRGAKGSVTWATVVVSKTGSVLHTNRQANNLTFVLAKDGDSLTLNHPLLTAVPGDPLHVMPTVLKQRSNMYTGAGSATIPVGDSSGLQVGQAVQLAFQDSNLRRIVAMDATSITVEANVFVDNGNYVIGVPAFIALTSAVTSNSTVLSFTAVPEGVAVGMQAFNADTPQVNVNIRVTAIDRESSPQTVTLSHAVTCGSGTRWFFWVAVQSAQIWSDWGIMPGEPEKQFVGVEFTWKAPDAASLAAWPSGWCFRKTDAPTGYPGTIGYTGLEIDYIELFNYFGLNLFACFRPGFGTPESGLYSVPGTFVNGVLLGNNGGVDECKIQVVWGLEKVFWYFNSALIMVRNFTWNRAYLAEIGINLAIGNIVQNSNGFFPLDFSQFPMKLRLSRLRILTAA